MALKTLSRYVARRRQPISASAESLRWVAVEAEPRPKENHLAVVLRCGRRIEVERGFNADALRQLVLVLERT